MAAPNPNPTPITRIEYPIGNPKRDALTAGGDGPQTLHAGVQPILNSAINGDQPSNPNLQPTPFDNAGTACYRNAALGVLLNLRPFLNYLYSVRATNSNVSCSTLLSDVAAMYWHPTLSDHERYARIQNLANQWFTHLTQQQGQIAPWDTGHVTNQADCAEFLAYVLRRIHDHDVMG